MLRCEAVRGGVPAREVFSFALGEDGSPGDGTYGDEPSKAGAVDDRGKDEREQATPFEFLFIVRYAVFNVCLCEPAGALGDLVEGERGRQGGGEGARTRSVAKPSRTLNIGLERRRRWAYTAGRYVPRRRFESMPRMCRDSGTASSLGWR